MNCVSPRGCGKALNQWSHSRHGKGYLSEADDVEWRERSAQVEAPVTTTNTHIEVAESHSQRRLVGGIDEEETPN